MIVKNIVIIETNNRIKVDIKDADIHKNDKEEKISLVLDKILMTSVKSDKFDKLLNNENIEIGRKEIWN